MQKTFLLFDNMGRHLAADSVSIACRSGLSGCGGELVTRAVRDLGWVALGSLRNALLVTLDPHTVSHLAAFAAFYEIAGRAPDRLVLAFSSENGSPSHYEMYFAPRDALKRVEGILAMGQHSPLGLPLGGTARASSGRPMNEPSRPRQSASRHVRSLRGRGGWAVRVLREDCSETLNLPLEAISTADNWMESLLNVWQSARRGPHLPSIESSGLLHFLGAAAGRAHVLDTSEADPTNYWFRLWGAVNSYGTGHTTRRLSQMPAGLMRDNAIEDYWEVVTMGVARYHLLDITEDRATYSYARLLLPFANDGRRVDHLLALINERDLEREVP